MRSISNNYELNKNSLSFALSNTSCSAVHLKVCSSEMFFVMILLGTLVSVWLSEAGLGKLLVGVIKKKSPSAALSNSSSFFAPLLEEGGRGRLLQVPSILLGQDVWTKKCDWCSISGRLCCQYCLWASPSSIHLPQCFSHLSNISIFRCFHILFLTFFLGKHRLPHLVL